MAKHIIKCAICGQSFDLNTIQGVRYGARRYAHYTCYPTGELVPMPKTPENDPEFLDLKDYINNLFGSEANWPMIMKQIKKYLGEEYKYTYSGIKKSLEYFYRVKRNSLDKANGSLGIVPYIYQDAYNYYYSLWLANQKNETKEIELYVPKEKVVHITNPERKIKKRQLFTFLDEEWEDADGK